MRSPMTMVGGAIPQGLTLTCLNLHLRPLPSTGPELFLFFTGSMFYPYALGSFMNFVYLVCDMIRESSVG